jgi:hypothetical protein
VRTIHVVSRKINEPQVERSRSAPALIRTHVHPFSFLVAQLLQDDTEMVRRHHPAVRVTAPVRVDRAGYIALILKDVADETRCVGETSPF